MNDPELTAVLRNVATFMESGKNCTLWPKSFFSPVLILILTRYFQIIQIMVLVKMGETYTYICNSYAMIQEKIFTTLKILCILRNT